MNAITFSKGGYNHPHTPVRSQRRVEYDLLARTTKRLSTAWNNRKADFPELAAAVSDNQRLWSTFAADVATPGNGLPSALRASLFYLYEFTEKHSGAILFNGASAQVLVDINTSVMRGLRGTGGAE